MGFLPRACRLEHRFESYKWDNSAGLAVKAHVVLGFCWLLAACKVVKWAWQVSAGRAPANVTPLAVGALLAVAALQGLAVACHMLTSLGLLGGAW